ENLCRSLIQIIYPLNLASLNHNPAAKLRHVLLECRVVLELGTGALPVVPQDAQIFDVGMRNHFRLGQRLPDLANLLRLWCLFTHLFSLPRSDPLFPRLRQSDGTMVMRKAAATTIEVSSPDST